MSDDRVILALAYLPSVTLATLGWAGVLDSSAFPGINAAASAVAALFYVISAVSAARLGIEGTVVSNVFGALTLIAYSINNFLLATARFTQAQAAAVGRPLFPLLLTTTIVGPAMFRRWKSRKADELMVSLRKTFPVP